MIDLAEWLALRERADAAARSDAVTAAVAESLPACPVRALDLGTGTGSNIRYLSARVPNIVSWRAVDRDANLLAHLPENVQILHRELGVLDRTLFAGCHLVTASALLDLVSRSWIEQLAAAARSVGAAVLFALSYNGDCACMPREPEDDLVRDLFNQHQRASDKGFGRAAGPDAVQDTLGAFAAAGYELRHARSDWHLSPDTAGLQRPLLEGWAEAASEIAPDAKPAIEAWLRRRLAHVDRGRSEIQVGHVDIGGWPVR